MAKKLTPKSKHSAARRSLRDVVIFPAEGKGQLPLMLFWQTLDGRPAFKDYDTLAEAKKHVEHLRSLGRTPQLYGRLEI